jgi:hypothetical protein
VTGGRRPVRERSRRGVRVRIEVTVTLPPRLGWLLTGVVLGAAPGVAAGPRLIALLGRLLIT